MTQTKNSTRPHEKMVGSYFIGRTLGEGSFAKVKMGTHKNTGKRVALKFIQHDKDIHSTSMVRLQREIEIQKRVRHANIAQLLEVIEVAEDNTCLVVELVDGRDLIEYLDEFPESRLPEREACKVFQQITSAIHYLHENGVVHRDIKLENVMISHDGICKLIDFGFASYWTINRALKTPCGSAIYAAPEILSRKTYRGPKTDVWGLGVLLYCLTSGKIPWAGDNATEQLYNTVRGNWSDIEGASKALTTLISGCLTADQEARFGIYDVLQSEWMRGEIRKRVMKRKLSGTIKDIVKRIVS
ncbi:hypothetical protein PROFUN_09059 [Planoprotostelium fungivorum]|uniref:non-specific serine/threonine protein kinase n=1 Tax=Planoprotostelium fungivorum TaxID=1890364 RepID=A0A2P6NIG3_9EUKA|nr:hypothetical protein PROFUN_09059 [Planoprotostelium fungivorum]